VAKVSDNWEKLNEMLKLEERIASETYVEISAQNFHDIGVQPRLNAKFDTADSLPELFKRNKWGILPNSRNSYLVGAFEIFASIPDVQDNKKQSVQRFRMNTTLESVDLQAIYSEAAALNVMFSSGLLNHILDEEALPTVSGRMNSGTFKFRIDTTIQTPKFLELENVRSTMEVDAGYESKQGLHLFEAKNSFNPTFNVRQLYFPFRNWQQKVNKPVNSFLLYKSGDVYEVREFEFSEITNYSSLKLKTTRKFTIGDFTFTKNDLISLVDRGPASTDRDSAPFPQADEVNKYELILNNLQDGSISKTEIAELCDFDSRQADYYASAIRFLGLVRKSGPGLITLTQLGAQYLNSSGSERKALLIGQMSQLSSFRWLFNERLVHNREVDKSKFLEAVAKDFLDEYGEETTPSMVRRRSQTISSWVSWIENLSSL
jgi:hypothetical protein